MIGFAKENLFTIGALDVYTIATGMKKNRPGTEFHVLSSVPDKDSVMKAIFKYTSTLGIRERTPVQMEADSEKILSLLDSYDGVLPFSEKADPAVIKRETGMSKNEFKRAIGHLLKTGKIEIRGKVIRRKGSV